MTPADSPDPRLIRATDATPHWKAWDADAATAVNTIHLGKLDAKKPLSIDLPPDLKTRFKNLTHLRLWGLEIAKLPPLPEGLKALDIRRCDGPGSGPPLPSGLEELILQDLPTLAGLDLPAAFPALWDLSLKGCPAIPQNTIQSLLDRASALRWLDLSGCAAVVAIPSWPDSLEQVVLNDCAKLTRLPQQWPARLRRLELKGATQIDSLGDEVLPAALDYLDLRGTRELRHLPSRAGRPRTLFIHGSGLELPNELFGETEDHNAASAVWAHLDSRRGTEHEVKLILLGNGRAGKSSLARRLVKGDFDKNERSTHGIRLWQHSLTFEPVDEPGVTTTVKLNIWDFAGQDLYHNAHRMFLQSKAIFLLCDTAAGDGADPESDGTDSDGLPPGWDVDRTLHYWRGQVEALGLAPQMGEYAPMLVVRTKSDRDNEPGMVEKLAGFTARNSDSITGLKTMDFSAKNGDGLKDLGDWISQQAARVLGRKGKRELTEGALRVKEEWRKIMAKNDEAHEAVEGTTETARPPDPVMTFEVAKADIARLCVGEGYGERPELLLELLHLSGFLFYKPEYLPDEVILDQRWAILGMYAAFDRENSWPRLVARKGLFRSSELKVWGWDKHGYSEGERNLFLRFMETCGMAYPVGERRGEQEYVVPRALPEHDTDVEREAADYRGGLPVARTLALSHKSLSRDSVLELLCRLGREWGRAPVLWLWGGQFESYRRWHYQDDLPPTFVHLNWTPQTPDSYGGTLELTQYGSDESFPAAVLNECRKLGGFREVDVPVIDIPREDSVSIDELRKPERRDDGRLTTEGHKRPADLPPVVEVGISFAGDQSGKPRSWETVPADSIERWPLALAAYLREHFRFKVEQYRTEQSRDPHEQVPGRKGYLDRLVGMDFMFVFISEAYLQSPWCMYEFLKVFERCGRNGEQCTELVRIGRFKEALWSQANQSGKDPLVEFETFWRNWYLKFKTILEGRIQAAQSWCPDINAHQRELDGWAYADWARCVADNGKFQAIKQALNSNGWNYFSLETSPNADALKDWALALSKNTERQTYLFDRANTVWTDASHAKDEKAQRHLYNKAQRLFIQGFFGEDPDGQPEGLEAALQKPIGNNRQSPLNQIRRSVQEEYRELLQQGRQIGTWQELAEAVAPEPNRGDSTEIS